MTTIVLNGFMASGKSTVGLVLADRLGMPFVDLDSRVEARAGASIPDLFRTRGEASFRAVERECLLEVLAGEPVVVAVGGGALVDRSLRLDVLGRARVFTLRVSAETAVKRAAGSPRPLLGDLAQATTRLHSRADVYAECHGTVDAEQAPSTVVEGLVALAGRHLVAVACGTGSYAVEVGRGVLGSRLPEVISGASGVFLLSDHNVFAAHGDAVLGHLRQAPRADVHCIVPGEANKTVETLTSVWRALQQAELDRSGHLVALGGGVVGDLGGFSAATWLRGIRWSPLPTSLLACVDASVGGKTAIDLGEGKNAVGAFWQPASVVCDIDLMRTEPHAGYVSGLAEVVKAGLIGDSTLLALLRERSDAVLARDPDVLVELVQRSIAVKAAIVSRDPLETGDRRLLNLGHTVGHALEACDGYGTLSHGQAVSLGLVAASDVGVALGVTPTDLRDATVDLLRLLGLPTQLDAERVRRSLSLLRHDKKREADSVRFIVVQGPSDVRAVNLPLDELRRLLAP